MSWGIDSKIVFNKTSLLVSFYSGKTGKPVEREYYSNKESIRMLAEFDYYKSSLEVELWEKGKGFRLCLLYDLIHIRDKSPEYCLSPGLSIYENDKFLKKYFHLFEPLDYYYRIEKK